MNLLVLRLRQRKLDYACYTYGQRTYLLRGTYNDYHSLYAGNLLLQDLLVQIAGACRQALHGCDLDAIAIEVVFGGLEFPGPAFVGSEVIRKLKHLVTFAPLHIPILLEFIECCQTVFSTIPIVLVFETSFFLNLPQREYTYAIDPDILHNSNLRRYGFHGLLHEAAMKEVSRQCLVGGETKLPRIISHCLESRPEIAAMVGHRPVMVTSGATPLEGLPGAHTCGELDPSIVISLAHDRKWGLEQVHNMLVRQSGLSALLGKSMPLEALGGLKTPHGNAVRDYFRYQLLKACGSAVAAMGGVDALVFSGRAVELGEMFGPWLIERLSRSGIQRERPIFWTCFHDTIERIVADKASSLLLGSDVKIAV